MKSQMTANMSAGPRFSATDGETIAASLREPARFAAVFDHHHGEISTYLARRVDRGLAEELASETFVRAFAARSGYDFAYPDARPWLYGIATNLLRRHARSEERRRRAYARAPARRAARRLGRTGRPARRLRRRSSGGRRADPALFDPETSMLLGERSVVVSPPRSYHVMPGTVWSGATYITSGIVDRIGQAP
jgi:DNA-directed RNA polymerase specialized sigma24 family protein